MSSLQQRTAAPVARLPLHVTGSQAARAWPSERDEALHVIESVGTPLQFARDETIFVEGDETHSVYRVAQGVTRSCRILIDGRRQIAGFGLQGDFLGLEWQPLHTLTAEAVTDVRLIRYPRERIERLGDAHPALRHEIMHLLVTGLTETEGRLVMLGRQTAVERLAWFLVRKASRLASQDGTIDLPMSRLDIADYLGLTIETVSRVFSLLKKKRWIALTSAHQIRIENLRALQCMARGEGAA